MSERPGYVNKGAGFEEETGLEEETGFEEETRFEQENELDEADEWPLPGHIEFAAPGCIL